MANRVMEMLKGTAEVSGNHIKEVVSDIEAQLIGERMTNNMLKESLADLEFKMEDEGWRRLGWEGEREFSRDGLRKIVDMSRIMTLKNPLIQRAVEIRSFYVWGQSVQIKGRDEGVNEYVQEFLDDIGNQRELFSHASRILKDKKLATDGNIFFVLDTSFITGKVNLRSIPFDEIDDIVVNPNDAKDVWFYVRVYNQKKFDKSTGKTTSKQKKVYYPDYWHALKMQQDPKGRASQIGNSPIHWSQPVYHMKTGGLDDMRFGVPETYSSLDWARAYKSFLEDWASLVRAISMFAWKYTTKKNKLQASRAKLEAMTGDKGEKPPAGSFWTQSGDGDLVPINKSGATTSAADGKMLRLMVASGMHLPDTILSNDPQQGALATAQTLDRPTELAMSERQNMWGDTIRAIIRYVLIQAVWSPLTELTGSYDAETNKLVIDSDDEEVRNPATVDVLFPSIVVPDMKSQIESIVQAMTLDGKAPANVAPDDIFRSLLLTTLGVEDVDEIVERMQDDDVEVATAVAAAEESLGKFVESLKELIDKAA